MNRYPLWKYVAHRRRARRRHPLHAAQLLPGSAGGAGVDVAATVKVDAAAARDRRGARSRPRTSRYRGAALDPTGIKVRLRRPRHAAQGEGRAAERKLGENYIVALNLLSSSPQWLAVDRRAADVPRPRPARRRALPAAGRHEGARSTRPPTATRPTSARCCARRSIQYARRLARRQQRRAALPRRRRAHEGARRDRERVSRPRRSASTDAGAASFAWSRASSPRRRSASRTAPSQQNIRSCATASTSSASPSRSSSSRAATASSCSSPACRTRRARRTSSAARRRSRSAWSTTIRARSKRALAGQRPVRQRPLHRAQRHAGCWCAGRSSLTGDRINDAQPGLRPAHQRARRPHQPRRRRRATSSRKSRARTSASAWRSCWSRRARPKSSPRR